MNMFLSFSRRLLPALLFITFMWSAHAEEDLNATPALWLIEKGAAKTYFLGSVHLLPDEVKWYGGPIKEAMEMADEVVFEVHMTPEKQAEAQQITLKTGMLDSGDSLSNYLSAEEFEFVVAQAAAAGIPSASIGNYKPWFASIALSVSAIIKEGWNPSSGVDKYIEKIAIAEDIPISELETLEEQMATLYDHPLDVQTNMLIDTLEQLKDIKAVTLEMINSWSSGDADKMEEAFITPMKEQKEIYQKLVVQRNNNWIPVIEGLLNKSQTTLVVAGVAHFVGEDGVVTLLTNKGYQVRKIQ